MRWTRMVLLLLVATFAITPAARADTFTVVTFGDEVGAGCAGTSCQSLRAAVAAAWLTVGPDTIVIPNGDFQLAQGQIVLDSDVAIVGRGARSTTVRGNAQAFRAFEVRAGVTASISGVSLVGGRANPQADNPSFFAGGLVRNSGALTLDRVRVTGGIASSGGGIANTGGTLTIDRSLIDNNSASIGGSDAGGLLNFGGGTLVVRNTTIAFNQAGSIGGYLSWGGSQARPNTALFEFVTIARNGSVGVGRDVGSGDTLRVRASIIVANASGNCSQAPENLGGTVESSDDCLFDQRGANGAVAEALTNEGGSTNVLALPATSVARDLIPAGQCLATDQRGATRPIGTACDAGAFEAGSMTTAITAPAADAVTDAETIEIRGIAPSNVAVTVSRAGAVVADTNTNADGDFDVTVALVPGEQTLEVAAGTNAPVSVRVTRQTPVAAQPTPAPTAPPAPTATPSPAPTPTVNRTIVVAPERGTILVKLKGAKTYTPLDATKGIPVGSTVDTRKGRVKLTSIPKAGAPPETAVFYDGIFTVTQARGITDLKLVEPLAACPKGRASTAAKKAKKRKLWGDGKGAFRTSGKYSAATVRGTKWLVEDSCAGTLTRVTQGSVKVRHRGRTIVVRAGKRYLARPSR